MKNRQSLSRKGNIARARERGALEKIAFYLFMHNLKYIDLNCSARCTKGLSGSYEKTIKAVEEILHTFELFHIFAFGHCYHSNYVD